MPTAQSIKEEIEKHRSEADDRVVLITLTEEGRALQDKAKDIPVNVAGCIDLPPEKAQTLYSLLYELLDNSITAEGYYRILVVLWHTLQ